MGIRAKTILADGDNYYETRWFGFWKEKQMVDEFKLPLIIQELTCQTTVPIGVFLIDFNDACLGYEICEEAWISDNPMIEAVMDGVEIIVNPSASNVERGKLTRKLQMLKELTQRHGGSYLYTNVKGCSGDRIYFDGGCIFT
jgi:NAD+ synthase (glutamine-hydrolysing)